jgi:hypothetical protein
MRSRSSVANKSTTDEKPNPAALTPSATDRINNEEHRSKPAMESQLSIGADQTKLVDKVVDDQEQRDKNKRRAEAEAPKRARDLTMGTHARIVDHLFTPEDPMEVYTRVRTALSFGGRASSMGYGALADALDEAEKNAADAFQLMVNAKVALDAFNLDMMVIKSTLRTQALADLQAQVDARKAEKLSTKTITNDDIDAVMASKFPDEYRSLESQSSKNRRTIAALEDLAERARERAKDLRALVGKSRDA